MDARKSLVLFHWLTITVGSTSTLITQNLKSTWLTTVTENLNTNAELLILKANKIHNIAKHSLANYHNHIKLGLERNEIRYMHNGSFDQNPKLQYLPLNANSLCYIAADFGLA